MTHLILKPMYYICEELVGWEGEFADYILNHYTSEIYLSEKYHNVYSFPIPSYDLFPIPSYDSFLSNGDISNFHDYIYDVYHYGHEDHEFASAEEEEDEDMERKDESWSCFLIDIETYLNTNHIAMMTNKKTVINNPIVGVW